jgi:hypothetical protein
VVCVKFIEFCLLLDIGEFEFGQQEDAHDFCYQLLAHCHKVLFDEAKRPGGVLSDHFPSNASKDSLATSGAKDQNPLTGSGSHSSKKSALSANEMDKIEATSLIYQIFGGLLDRCV